MPATAETEVSVLLVPAPSSSVLLQPAPPRRAAVDNARKPMDIDDAALLFDVFEAAPRQGPGSPETTRRALELVPDAGRIERVLDLGCGAGGPTLVLAEDTDAHIVAVDLHRPFLATLRAEAEARGLGDRITTVAADMGDVAALGDGYDLIWAEGSAYAIGFETALRRWRPLLRPGGSLVVTELVWFVPDPAARARAFFAAEYPDLRDEATRIEQAKRAGYDVLHTFRLPARDWHAYYAGLEAPLRAGIARHGEREAYTALLRERAVYEACGDDYGYLCLVLQAA